MQIRREWVELAFRATVAAFVIVAGLLGACGGQSKPGTTDPVYTERELSGIQTTITHRLAASGVQEYAVAVLDSYVEVSVNPGTRVDLSGLPPSAVRVVFRDIDIDDMDLPLDD